MLPNGLSLVSCHQSLKILLPLGPLNSLISTTVSKIGRLLRTYSRTIDPASLRASTALLWETSDTSTSFTRKIQSLTLKGRKRIRGQRWLSRFLKEYYYGHLSLRSRGAKNISNFKMLKFGKNILHEGNEKVQ